MEKRNGYSHMELEMANWVIYAEDKYISPKRL
jgi:hypothetical protein